jgi:hypothetical protein
MREKRIFRGDLPADVFDEKTAGFLTLVQKQTNCSKL